MYLHKFLKKKWSEQDINELIGSYDSTFLAYAQNDRIRYGGASGGTTTALLTFALDQGLIDGALVCRTRISDCNVVRPEFFIATDPLQLFASQDSRYTQTDFVPQALNLIDGFDGRLAVVGLPCDLSVLRKRIARKLELAEKIVFTIGLFCGHNSQPQLIDNVIHKLAPHRGSTLQWFRFRTGLWRGFSLAQFDDIILEKKSSYYNLYQNLYFFCQPKCLRCHDHFGYNADISLGDIWSYHLKNETIKYNSIIAKNTKASGLLKEADHAGYIILKDLPVTDILDGQARGAPTHNNTSAKSKAGKRFGLNIPDRHNKKVTWHAYLVAWMILFNFTWSMHPKYSKLIFKMPRKLLKIYLLFLKGLESLK